MRKHYDDKFKSKVALEAIEGEKSIAEIASYFKVHPNLVSLWKKINQVDFPLPFSPLPIFV